MDTQPFHASGNWMSATRALLCSLGGFKCIQRGSYYRQHCSHMPFKVGEGESILWEMKCVLVVWGSRHSGRERATAVLPVSFGFCLSFQVPICPSLPSRQTVPMGNPLSRLLWVQPGFRTDICTQVPPAPSLPATGGFLAWGYKARASQSR